MSLSIGLYAFGTPYQQSTLMGGENDLIEPQKKKFRNFLIMFLGYFDDAQHAQSTRFHLRPKVGAMDLKGPKYRLF